MQLQRMVDDDDRFAAAAAADDDDDDRMLYMPLQQCTSLAPGKGK